jgi:hypothetical protein
MRLTSDSVLDGLPAGTSGVMMTIAVSCVAVCC